jgi:phage tail-like protein
VASAPLPAWSFRVTLGEETAGFSEVSGLSIERETTTYAHGLSHWEGETLLTYPSRKHRQISLKRGVVAANGLFHDWLVGADAEPRPMAVAMIDSSGAPALLWRIRSAVPVKLTGPTFDAAASGVAIEALDVMVSGVSVERV